MLAVIMRLRRSASLAAALILLGSQAWADSFPSWAAKAERAERRKDDEAAMQAWSNAIHLWKASDGKKRKAKAYASRAALHEKTQNWVDAAKDLSEAVKLEAKDARVFHRRGVAFLNQSKLSLAISDFYKATALKLDFSEAFFDRARAYELQGEAQFAREDYRVACDLGYKKACAKAGPAHGRKRKAGKKGGKPRTTAPEAEGESPPDQEEGPEEEGSAKAPLGKGVSDDATAEAEPDDPPPPDFKYCLAGLSDCLEGGESFGACVGRVKTCEDSPKKGCCPRDCLTMFRKRTNTVSEAQAYREIFKPKSACLTVQPK